VDSQDKTSQQSSECSDGVLPPQSTEPVPSIDTAEPKAEQQLTKVEREMSSFERATLNWARIAAGLSFVAAIFICGQWWEMRRGGEDTHNLAVAAQAQAKAAEQAVKTSNRPWIALVGDVTLRPRDSFTEAIEKMKGKLPPSQNAVVVLPFYEMTVQNFGSSPALDVSTDIQPFMPADVPLDKWVSDFNKATNMLCQDIYNPPSKPGKFGTDSGQTIFPGNTGIQEIGGGLYGVSIDDINNSERSTQPQIIGCIRYKDQLGNIHHTRFCVEGNDWKSPLRPCGMGESAD
jgi:hypothetical protein